MNNAIEIEKKDKYLFLDVVTCNGFTAEELKSVSLPNSILLFRIFYQKNLEIVIHQDILFKLGMCFYKRKQQLEFF